MKELYSINGERLISQTQSLLAGWSQPRGARQ
jgi:hypothetical protein